VRTGHKKVDCALAFGAKSARNDDVGEANRLQVARAGINASRAEYQTRPAKGLAHFAEKVPARREAAALFAQLNRDGKM